MFHTIYQGSLSTRTAELFRVSIQQDMQDPPAAVSQLTFPYDEPLIIERDITEFYEPIITTTATLRVISPADRTFLPLFSVKPASVRLLVEQKTSPTVWKTYYIGTLDTDSYEEPYAYLSDYIVELNFSDLGCLHRLKCSLSGYVTLHDIISAAMKAAAIPIDFINLITSTSTDVRSQNVPLTPDNILLNAANFIDEDNEPLNLYDALEAVLKPLAWKFVIHQTAICIFELHAIYNLETPPTDILWMQDDQNLSVSPVYNDVIITFSPYTDTGTPDETPTAFPHKTDPNVNALDKYDGVEYGDQTRYYSLPLTNDFTTSEDTSVEDIYSDDNRGFTIFTSKQGIGASMPENSKAVFFKIQPQGSGEEDEGVALVFSAHGKRRTVKRHGYRANEITTSSNSESIVLTFDDIVIPPLTEADQADFMLRLSVPALIDYRYNPFASPSEEPTQNARGFLPPNKDNEAYWNAHINFIYIPVIIEYRPNNRDDVVYYYLNYSYTNYNTTPDPLAISRPVSNPVTKLYFSDWNLHCWRRKGDLVFSRVSYLAYYPTDDRNSTTAISGSFTENRPAINPHNLPLANSLANAESGEYITLDGISSSHIASGGRISVSVLPDCWKFNKAGSADLGTEQQEAPEHIRWLLLKLPSVTFQRQRPYNAEYPEDDIETRTLVNAHAEETLEIDIIFGSIEENPIPTARGNVYLDFKQVQYGAAIHRIDTIKRADRSGTFQQLLAATIYSQYAVPHIRLSGTCQPVSPIRRYTDVSSPGIVFIPIASCEDVRAQTSEVTFAQLSPESYEKA